MPNRKAESDIIVSELQLANLRFQPDDGRLCGAGSEGDVHLRPQASRLLQYLIEHAGEVVARERLYEVVWGRETVVDFESGLAALMRELRQSIRTAGGPDGVIETVPRRGYRIDASLCRRPTPGRGQRRPVLIILLLMAVVAAGSYATWRMLHEPEPVAAADARNPGLAVIPFTVYDAGQALPEHVDLLLADTLLAELLSHPLEGLDLIGRASLKPYYDRTDLVSAVAENLGAELLIEGTVLTEPGRPWQVELHLLEVPSGRVAWSESIVGADQDPLSVRDVAAALAERLVRAWPTIRDRRQSG